MLVVTGMHRSGTTYVGQVLDVCKNVDVFHEPFNRHFGLAGINKNYPAIDLGYEIELLDVLNDLALKREHTFIRENTNDAFFKRFVRKIIGGKTEQQWRMIRLTSLLQKKTLILKDPFLSFATKTMSSDLEYKVVYLCRHPGAVWSSIKQMDWKMDLNNFFGESFPVTNSKREIERFAEVWSTLNLHNYSYKNKNFLFMTHEELCINPIASFNKIFTHLNLEFTTKARQLVNTMSNADEVDKEGNKLHQFKRNSAKIVDSWRNKLSKEEHEFFENHKAVRNIVEKIYCQ